MLLTAVERQDRVGPLLHTLVANFGQPELDKLDFGAEDGLDDAKQCANFGAIGLALLAVRRRSISTVRFSRTVAQSPLLARVCT